MMPALSRAYKDHVGGCGRSAGRHSLRFPEQRCYQSVFQKAATCGLSTKTAPLDPRSATHKQARALPLERANGFGRGDEKKFPSNNQAALVLRSRAKRGVSKDAPEGANKAGRWTILRDAMALASLLRMRRWGWRRWLPGSPWELQFV